MESIRQIGRLNGRHLRYKFPKRSVLVRAKGGLSLQFVPKATWKHGLEARRPFLLFFDHGSEIDFSSQPGLEIV